MKEACVISSTREFVQSYTGTPPPPLSSRRQPPYRSYSLCGSKSLANFQPHRRLLPRHITFINSRPEHVVYCIKNIALIFRYFWHSINWYVWFLHLLKPKRKADINCNMYKPPPGLCSLIITESVPVVQVNIVRQSVSCAQQKQSSFVGTWKNYL